MVAPDEVSACGAGAPQSEASGSNGTVSKSAAPGARGGADTKELGFQGFNDLFLGSRALVQPTISFAEYLSLVEANPNRHARNGAGFVRDAITYDVSEETTLLRLGQRVPKYPFLTDVHEPSGVREPAIGMDRVAHHFVQVLKEQAALPVPNRWALLFGPFGSGKSVFTHLLQKRVAHFSEHHENGCLYRPVFEFPEAEGTKAFTLRLPLGCHPDPIFLLPKGGPREKFVERLKVGGAAINEGYLLRDGRDPLVDRIMRALVTHTKGDLNAVFTQFVRVERFSFSLGEGIGVATIDPQPGTPLTASDLIGKSSVELASLPPALQGVAHDLIALHGRVLATHRGLVLFDNIGHEATGASVSIDPYRETIESGIAAVMGRTPEGRSVPRRIPLDTMFMGCMNDKHLDPWFDSPDRQGRLLSIARPINAALALNCFDEREVLRTKLERRLGDLGAASPHALLVLSLFAVSTRVFNPQASYYDTHSTKPPEGLGKEAAKLTGVAKAIFFSLPCDELPNEAINWSLSSKQRLSPRMLDLLMERQRLVAQEFSAGLGTTRASLYDGGTGLNGRDMEALLSSLVAALGERRFGVSGIIGHLERQIDHGYPFEVELASQRVREAQRRAELDPDGEDEDFHLEQLNEERAVPGRSELLVGVARFGRRLIQRDVARALKLPFEEQASFELRKYIAHIRAKLLPGHFEVPREFRQHQRDTGPDHRFLSSICELQNVAPDKADDHFQQVFSRLTRPLEDGQQPMDVLDLIFPDILEVLRRNFRRESVEKELQFVNNSELYAENPDAFVRDLDKATDRTPLENWKAAWTRLAEGKDGVPRYPEQLLLHEVQWAYQNYKRPAAATSSKSSLDDEEAN